jgi:hypothetical protein
MPAAAPGAGGAMTELLRRAPDSTAPLAQECFKLLAALLRSCASYKVRAWFANGVCMGGLAVCYLAIAFQDALV